MNSIPDAIDLPIIFHFPSEPILKQQTDELFSIGKKIERVSQSNFSRVACLTMKYVWADLKEKNCTVNSFKILASTTFMGLLGLGFITSYASINLLYNTSLSSAFSSSIATRVNYANTVTNAGALFTSITDIPAITYSLYLFIIKDAYRKAVHKLSDEAYHSSINDPDHILTPEMREELYQEHISELQRLGVKDYYLRPDPLAPTGALHAALAPRLKEIDLEINKGVTFRAVWKRCMETFRQESCVAKLAKVALGSVGAIFILFAQALSTFVILENGILINDTPVRDLFSSNSTSSLNEAFYLTQEGNVFSSITSFATATYLCYLLFFRTAYKKTMCEKICASFADRFSDLSTSMSFALHRIREIKLKKI